MRFTNVSGYNIKGHNFNIDLEPVAVLVGPSKSGKSAVLDAITIGALGYHPAIGKTNKATFQLASADAMSVVLTSSEGSRTERAWQRKGESVTASHVVGHGMGEFPPVMLSAKEYFERSPEQRAQLVFSCLNMTNVPLKERIAEIDKLLAAQNVGVIITDRNAFPEIPNETFQQWLERFINVVGDQRREKDTEFRKFTSTTQALGQQIADAVEVNLPADYDERLAAADLDRKEKSEAYHQLKAKHAVHAERKQARLSLQTQADKLRERTATMGELKAAMFKAALKTVNVEADVLSADDKMRDAQTRYIECEQVFKSAIQSLEDTKALRDEVLAQSKCPTCQTNQPTWKTRVRNKFAADIAKLEAERDKSSDQLAAARDAFFEAQNDLKVADRTAADQRAVIAECQEIQIKLDAAADAEKELEQVEKAIARLNGSFDDEAFYRAECDAQDADEAYEELNALRQHVANHKAAQKELETAAATRDQAEWQAATLKKVEGILREVRNNYMTSEFAPFLQLVSLFTKDILDTPLEYRNNELGRTDASGRWINAATFSGAETAATHAAISAALGAQAPVKIAVVDELQRMDDPLKRTFVVNVGKAINDGVLDQFIGADVNEAVYALMAEQAASGELNLGTLDGKKQIGLQLLNLQ